MSILVSAIITTYKREPEIVLRAANSVLNQTYKNLELIVVDDSPSTYEYREQIKKALEIYGDRVRYIQHEVNMGACVARNTGLDNAKGQFVGYLDDDDEWLPEKIEKQMQGFSEDDIALVYCGNKRIYDETGVEEIPSKKFASGFVFNELMLENFVGSTSFPLIRKDFLKEIGGFDPLMKSAQDYDVWLRLAEKYKINYVNEPLVIYHAHGGVRISNNPKNKIEGVERIIEKNIEFLTQNKYAWWFRNIKLAPLYAKDRQLKKALTIWLRASIKFPHKVRVNLKYLCKVFVEYYYYANKS